MAHLTPALLSLITEAAKHGEKFMQEFDFSVRHIHRAMTRCRQESIDPLTFRDALEIRVKVIEYVIEQDGALPDESKTVGENTHYALTQLDRAAKTCFDKKVDMLAFYYALQFYIGSIDDEMYQIKRNKRMR